MRRSLVLIGLIAATPSFARAADAPPAYRAGVAQADITPTHPVRLAGFGFRRAESEGVTQRIRATALALDDGEPAVLVAADLCGVPAAFADELAKRLQASAGLKRERFILTVTHTHTGPMVAGYLPTLFGVPIPDEHTRNIDRYSRDLMDKLEAVVKAALADRKPAALSWGVGSVGFAMNRRDKGGPVDHDLPVLVIRGADGKVRAVFASYACHCVTLSNNMVSGDWAGFAREAIEAENPGAVALIAIGCGADQNPVSGVTGDKVDIATAQGRTVAAEVKRLVGGWLAPVTGKLSASARMLDLSLADPPSRAAWEEKVKQNAPNSRSYAIGYHAQVQLGRIDRGEALPAKVPYRVQTWTFGDDLAMAFLPGEVVVDYSLRLKKELDGRRLWINAYSNDVPCYIPSERILKEGRYEGGGAMVYYDLPGPFKPGLEQPIIDAVKGLVGERFRAPFNADRTGGTQPLSPQQSLAAIRMRPGFVADLVAAEPLLVDPVAIDWAPDGRMYVCEMHDYPTGSDGQFRPAGQVRLLRDSDGDGRYDAATVFLDGIPFPTGVTVWRNGVLVCAAPDILYAEDTDGDGKADTVKKLYSGFGTHNYQARVNSLEYGLDGWVYGSCGLFGGTITSFNGTKLALGDRDFRIKPDTGEIEPATGRTQQGRPRDDWGNWFGCENTVLAVHYPHADHDLRRNPHVPPPPQSAVRLGPTKLFPANPKMQLFKLSGPPGLPTAICGLGVYRDDLLGPEVTGDLFSCEPVNMLVTRRKLVSNSSSFRARRADGEAESEFLASTDPWFRPVQARTGPDGCLYVVDMYRCVIEHPRWIPAEDAAKLDVRAGSSMGRIYRVAPSDKTPRVPVRLDRLDLAGLVKALESPNGWQRDLATQMLLWSNATDAAGSLVELATTGPRPEERLHALSALDGLGKLDATTVVRSLSDKHPGVRRHVVRIAGDMVGTVPDLGAQIAGLVTDPDPKVQQQVAVALGNWRNPAAGLALFTLARKESHIPEVLSSINATNVGALLEAARSMAAKEPGQWGLLPDVVALGIAFDQRDAVTGILRALAESRSPSGDNLFHMLVFGRVYDELDRRWQTLGRWAGPASAEVARALIAEARSIVLVQQLANNQPRVAAIGILNRDAKERDADQRVLEQVLGPTFPAQLRTAAATALARDPSDATADRLLTGWAAHGPALQSHVLDLLLTRDGWRRRLLDAIESNKVAVGQIDASRRQRLLAFTEGTTRDRAVKLFAGAASADRQRTLEEFRDVLHSAGNHGRGKEAFVKHCAACHRLDGAGHAVGPDLATVAGKSPAYLLQEILDPNRNMDARYVEYRATLRDGRQISGVIASEGGSGFTLRAQDGRDQPVIRSSLDSFDSTGKSLMPEGLERQMSRQDLADVIAYITATVANDMPDPAKATPADLARGILDDARPAAERQALVTQTVGRAAPVVAALVADMPADAKEEYRRIPWVWRVAVAAGKRNDPAELRGLLDVSLPKPNEPLRHWQAVVVGGGVINGVSERRVWPRQRMAELLREDAALLARWRQALDQSSAMADDSKVPTGTRYDALRMMALDTWEKRGEQLAKYLAKETHAELQQGAISGLSDLDAPPVAERLLAGVSHYSASDRALAFDALLRTESRATALLDALQEGRVTAVMLGEKHKKALREHANAALRARAAKLLP